MSLELSFAERRVLGTLIEKSFTTPDQYPLTVNGVVVGSNQKSCRDPVSKLDEPAAHASLESLREKGLTLCVRTEGSRTVRWKHRAGDRLELSSKELAVLAELLLRGPQSDGELRQRASRMVPLESLEEVDAAIQSLSSREEPLARRLTPPGKRRGAKYGHTLETDDEGRSAASAAPRAEETDPPAPVEEERTRGPEGVRPPVEAAPQAGAAGAAGDLIAELRRRVRALEERVEELEATFVRFLR